MWKDLLHSLNWAMVGWLFALLVLEILKLNELSPELLSK